jgi:hypothetical protein
VMAEKERNSDRGQSLLDTSCSFPSYMVDRQTWFVSEGIFKPDE